MKIQTFVLAAVLSAGTLLAQPGPGRGGHRGWANLDALTEVLDLSEQQVTDLRQARKSFRTEELASVRDQIREKRQALREEMQQDSPNAAVVGQLHVDIAALADQGKELHGQHATEVRALLTDAQRAKLDELQAAAALMPAVHQAMALSLLDAPEGAMRGGPGRFGRLGAGPGGFGHRGRAQND